VGDFERHYLTQKLRLTPPAGGGNLVFDGRRLEYVDVLIAAIDLQWAITIDRRALKIAIVADNGGKVQWSRFHSVLSFATSLSISRNRMFALVDFAFGMTRCYAVKYARKEPAGLMVLSDFSWDILPRSMCGGAVGLAATAAGEWLILWEICLGTVHRSMKFESKIVAFAFDDEHGVWIGTQDRLWLVSVNGDRLACLEMLERLTAIAAVPLHGSQTPRSAICGTISGGVFLARPNLRKRVLEVKMLHSEHTSRIETIAVHPDLKSFVTVDSEGACFAWSAFNIGGAAISPGLHESCALCLREPTESCLSCRRAVCRKCCQGGMCALCLGLQFIL
jgi:hypothetical protein